MTDIRGEPLTVEKIKECLRQKRLDCLPGFSDLHWIDGKVTLGFLNGNRVYVQFVNRVYGTKDPIDVVEMENGLKKFIKLSAGIRFTAPFDQFWKDRKSDANTIMVLRTYLKAVFLLCFPNIKHSVMFTKSFRRMLSEAIYRLSIPAKGKAKQVDRLNVEPRTVGSNTVRNYAFALSNSIPARQPSFRADSARSNASRTTVPSASPVAAPRTTPTPAFRAPTARMISTSALNYIANPGPSASTARPTPACTTGDNPLMKTYLTKLANKEAAELEEKSAATKIARKHDAIRPLKRKIDNMNQEVEVEETHRAAAKRKIGVEEASMEEIIDKLTGRQGYKLHELVAERNTGRPTVSGAPPNRRRRKSMIINPMAASRRLGLR